MKKQRPTRSQRFALDPKLIRITPEEIRADLQYPVGAPRRAGRA
jgi:hypothetical protein